MVVPLAVTCDAQDSRLGFFFLPQIPDFENESLARARRGIATVVLRFSILE